MKEKLLSIGGVFGSILSLSCCSGLMLLYTLGIGGTAFVFLSRIATFRPFFVILTVLCLGYAHFRMDKYPTSKRSVIFIWTATIIAILITLLPVLLNIYNIIFS
ncbi:hypothetical protein [Serpentinicella alkaliphila]|uniref:Mercuric ion transport protein n=1 Tax=Serpentinicella alkaliphila TaxID=1734049 RepID=A0A4R2TLA2_9FIRM|nr:hypothetical protein [Serpentinicella alkaliphila]QUH26455.1 hypothetical protein HZR23_12480 [Serpentinicella alkaliphila]TCQ03267.1 mercuric ion transport protein [Serpentinicella alkaliphila]